MRKREAIAWLIFCIAVVIATSWIGIPAIAEHDTPKLKKLNPGIVPTTAQVVEDEVVVRYREDLLPPKNKLKNREQALKNASKQLSEEHHLDVIGIHVRQGIIRFRIPPGLSPVNAASFFKDDVEVEYASPNYKVFPHTHDDAPPNDAYWWSHDLWGLQVIGMKQAWTINSTWTNFGNGPIVAVLDTGIDYEHPDLRPNRWKNTAECCWTGGGVPLANGEDDDNNGYTDDFWGINILFETSSGPNTSCVDRLTEQPFTQTRDPMDHDDHGTSMAGIIAAYGHNNDSTDPRTGFVGVAPRARLMAVKWMCSHPPANPGGLPEVWGNIIDAVDAVDYAIANGAAVINASWGIEGLPENDQRVQDLKAAIYAGRNTTLFVNSAGNSERNLDGAPDTIRVWPQKFDLENEIVVAATNPSDDLWNDVDPLCPQLPCVKVGSNYGSTSVDIAAPGENIWSTIPRRFELIGVASGTSMAAPHVAGCAALLQAQRGMTNSLSMFLPKDLKSELINKAKNAPLLATKIKKNTFNETSRVDCGKAITPPPQDTTPPQSPTGLRVWP